jgi:hypothetical protein
MHALALPHGRTVSREALDYAMNSAKASTNFDQTAFISFVFMFLFAARR